MPRSAGVLRTPTAACLTLALSVVLVGCGADSVSPDGPGAEGGLAAELAALPGVSDAAAGEVDLDQDVRGTEAVVDLEADPAVDEVAAVVEAIAAADVDRSAVYVEAGDVDYRPVAGEDGLSGLWQIQRDADASRVSEEMVAGLALLDEEGADGSAVVDLSPSGDPTVTTPTVTLDVGQVGPEVVTSFAEAVADDDVLADAVVEVRGEEDADGEAVSLRTGQDGMTADVLETWEDVVAAGLAAGGGVEVLPSYSVEGGRGLAALEAVVVLPEPAPFSRVTPDAYGDELRPVLRGLLDIVDEQRAGARLDVGYQGQVLASVTTGPRRPALSDVERRWNRESYDYLASLR